MGDEIIVDNMEIRKFTVFFYHFEVKMLAQFYRVVFTAGVDDRLACLPGPGAELKYLCTRSYPCIVDEVMKQFIAVFRTVHVKLIRDRIEDLAELLLLGTVDDILCQHLYLSLVRIVNGSRCRDPSVFYEDRAAVGHRPDRMNLRCGADLHIAIVV